MYVSVPCARTHRAPPGVCLEGDLPLPRWLLDLGHAQGDIGLGETRGRGPNQGRNGRRNGLLPLRPPLRRNDKRNEAQRVQQRERNATAKAESATRPQPFMGGGVAQPPRQGASCAIRGALPRPR